MTERRVSSEKCANCPNRGRIARLLARATRQNERAEDCKGSVKVSRGQIVTQARTGREASPPQETWTSMTSSAEPGGERRYRRIDWATETLCGQELVEPRDGEAPYGLGGEFLRTHQDGTRVAAFIKGDEKELTDHYGSLGMMALLDSLDDMQDAEDAGDDEGVTEAQNKIAQQGFVIEATAGRRGTKSK